MKISRIAEMRAMDQAAIARYAIPEELLMENAGLAATRVLDKLVPISSGVIAILCGIGNNGGDGLVMARHIHSAGGTPLVLIFGDPDHYRSAARLNFTIVEHLGLSIRIMDSIADIDAALSPADALVDALLGTGITRPVEGLYAAAIAAINRVAKPVLSVDIPSGVNGDTGQVMGVAVHADATISFGLPKAGNLLYPGYAHGGRLYASHIGFRPALYDSPSLQLSVNTPLEIPLRDPAGHKGTFGDVLFIAGAASYYGAPGFSALSFLKAGGGYARLAAPQSIIPTLAARAPEIVFLPQSATPSGAIAHANLRNLLDRVERADFVVLGPGLSLDPETQQLVRDLVTAAEKPLLLDGDGLTAVAATPDCIRSRSAPTVLTPHLGEMARLTGRTAAEIDADRVTAAQHTAADLGAIVVLKGAHTLIGYPDGRVYFNLSGNSGMATAGSGDVLTGAIAAMHGLGLPVEEAVRQGVLVHGLAGDLAAQSCGEDGITAQDIMEHLPAALHACRTGLAVNQFPRYWGPQIV